MKRNITIQDILNSKVGHLNRHLNDKPAKHAVKQPQKPRKSSKAKEWINTQLWVWSREKGLKLETEHRFHPARKWRFDWCLPELKIAIEYNGLISQKSRHTTVSGYTGDMDKINAAQALNWRVLQYTTINYKSMISDLEKIISEKNLI